MSSGKLLPSCLSLNVLIRVQDVTTFTPVLMKPRCITKISFTEIGENVLYIAIENIF